MAVKAVTLQQQLEIGFLNESSTSGWANCCASTYGQHMWSVPMGPFLEVTKFSALASRIGVKIHN